MLEDGKIYERGSHEQLLEKSGIYAEMYRKEGLPYLQVKGSFWPLPGLLAFKLEILVLDEAPANIDTETELLIRDALKKLTAGRTTLVVAHRLSTIQHADKIIVIHQGRIREMGTHQELLAKKGLYYQLYELQYKNSAYNLSEGPFSEPKCAG